MRVRPELRRLLIVIDGKRPVDSLLPLFRASEVPVLLNELLALGMIVPTETATSFLPTGARDIRDVTPLQPKQFEAACNAAAKAASDLLGNSAKPFIAKIKKCENSSELRVAVSQVQLELMAKLGPDAATLYVETLRAAVQNAA